MEAFDTAAHNDGRAVTIREAAAALSWSESKARRAMKAGQWRAEVREERGSQVYRIAWDSLPAGADWQKVEALREGAEVVKAYAKEGPGAVEAVKLAERLEGVTALYHQERTEKEALLVEVGGYRARVPLLEASAASLQAEKDAAREEAASARAATAAEAQRRQEAEDRAKQLAEQEAAARAEVVQIGEEATRLRQAVKWRTVALVVTAAAALLVLVGALLHWPG